MDPLDLLTSCYRAGVRVMPEGERLRLDGYRCPVELKDALILHKPAIIATLQTRGVGRPSPHRGVEPMVGYAVTCDNIICPVQGPCQSVLTGDACPLAIALGAQRRTA